MNNSLKDALHKVCDLLEKHNVEHMVIGGIAVIAWGDPRMTVDADFVISLNERSLVKVLRELKPLGFEFDEDLVIQTLQISGVVRIAYRDTTVDFIVGESDFEKEALKRKKRENVFGRVSYLASPEDLIVYKIYAGRGQDITDAERILIRFAGKLDIPHINRWVGWLTERFNNPAIEQRWATLRDKPIE